jgi:hypothetical protein
MIGRGVRNRQMKLPRIDVGKLDRDARLVLK